MLLGDIPISLSLLLLGVIIGSMVSRLMLLVVAESISDREALATNTARCNIPIRLVDEIK